MVFDAWSIAIVVILLLGALIGIKRGFAKQIKFLFGFFGAIIVAILLYKLVYLLLAKVGIEPSIAEKLTNTFTEKGGLFVQTVSEETYTDVLSGLLNEIKIPQFISNLVISKFPYEESFAELTYAQLIGMKLAFLAVNAIAFIAVFIVALIVLAIVYRLIKGIFEVKLLKPVDSLLGMVLGLVKAAILVCGVMCLLSFLVTKDGAVGEFVLKVIPKAPEEGKFSLGYWVYDTNPIMLLIGKLF